MEYGLLILHWMVEKQFYVIQLGGGDIDWGSVCGLQNQQPIFHNISYNKYIHNLFPK
jgi:hypothetical protein